MRSIWRGSCGGRTDGGVGAGCAARGDAGSHAARRRRRRSQIKRQAGVVACCCGKACISGSRTWTKAHYELAASQKTRTCRATHRVEEMLLAVRQRLTHRALEAAIRTAVPDWSLARCDGADGDAPVSIWWRRSAFLAEVGDLARFRPRCELMGYLGLTRASNSTGAKGQARRHHQGGNGRARRVLVDCSWSYRHPRASARRSLPRWPPRPRGTRDRLRRSRVCRGATARWRGAASGQPSWSPPLRASSQASSGRSKPLAREHCGKKRRIARREFERAAATLSGPSSGSPGAGPRSGEKQIIVQWRGRSNGKGNSDCALWPITRSIDARAETGTAPDEIGTAVSIRESELAHRRLPASPLPLHDHPRNSPSSKKTAGVAKPSVRHT